MPLTFRETMFEPVLFECLEDEMPSVAIDDQVPGSAVQEILQDYDACDSIEK